jgi:DNA-binding response OmpR family regulator
MDDPIGGTIKAGAVVVDPVARRAFVGDEEADLTGPELDLLTVFVRHSGEVLTPARLRELAWQATGPEREAVDAHVVELRRKIGEATIEPVTDVGYRFTGHREPYA